MPAEFWLLVLLLGFLFSAVIRKASKLIKENPRIIFYRREIPGI